MAKVFLECQLLYSLEKANKAWENYTPGNNANSVVVLWWSSLLCVLVLLVIGPLAINISEIFELCVVLSLPHFTSISKNRTSWFSLSTHSKLILHNYPVVTKDVCFNLFLGIKQEPLTSGKDNGKVAQVFWQQNGRTCFEKYLQEKKQRLTWIF